MKIWDSVYICLILKENISPDNCMLKADFILTEEEPIGFQQGTLPDYHIFTWEHFLAENLHYLQQN